MDRDRGIIDQEVLKIKSYWDERIGICSENEYLYHAYFKMEEIIFTYASYIRNGPITDKATLASFTQEAFMKLDSLDENVYGVDKSKSDMWKLRLQKCKNFLLQEAHYRERGIRMSTLSAEELRSL